MEIDKIVEEFEQKYCQDITDVGGFGMAKTIRDWLRITLEREIKEAYAQGWNEGQLALQKAIDKEQL
jgi:hypothetical protein